MKNSHGLFVDSLEHACVKSYPNIPSEIGKRKVMWTFKRCEASRNFVPFAQYLKNMKNNNCVLLSIKLQARLKPGTLLKAPLWVFFTFFETVKMVLNCAKRLRCKANTPLILSRQNAMLIVINIYSNITIGFEISVSPSRNAILLLLLLLSLLLLLLS